MEQHVHTLLVCAIFLCAAVSLLQIFIPYSQILKFAQAFSSLIHGSWYIQSGFILYNPTRSISPIWSTSMDYNNYLIWYTHTCLYFLIHRSPCKKYDRDSHWNSMLFSVTNRRQFGRNPHQIPWQFHVIYQGFICFSSWNMTWILDKFKSWNFHGIC